MELIAITKDLPLVEKAILTELKHYDLSNKVTYDGSESKGLGGFSEVFKGVFNRASDKVDVAVKRMSQRLIVSW